MKNILKYILAISGLLALVLAVLIFRPVPTVTASEALVARGIVTDIYEGGVHDVAFRLENNETVYYINRGLEQGLELPQLERQLMGKEITIYYPDYWTPLDWNDKIKHRAKVEINGQVIFSELVNK